MNNTLDISIPLPMEALGGITLGLGSHIERGNAVCVMEAVAWVAGEPHSDHPKCACPVITAFLVAWNDGLPSDDDRNRLLKPLIPKIINTRSTPEIEARRSKMALDWFIQEYTPAWLDLAGLTEEATALRENPSLENCQRAREKAAAAGVAAGDAAWDAARDAARDAAGDAAGDAAWDAAWVAARDAAWDAAWDAAGVAARDAAGDAAGVAAGDAAWEKLLPTVTHLQQSAVALVEKMIATN